VIPDVISSGNIAPRSDCENREIGKGESPISAYEKGVDMKAVRIGIAAAVAVLWLAAPVRSEELRVLTSGAFAAALAELGPQYERTTATRVIIGEGGTMGRGPESIPSRLQRGEPVDVLIMSATVLADFVKAGQVVAGSRVDLAQSGIGMAVKAGAPKPDIGSVEALKRTLLGARSIAVSSSISGVYLTTELFPKLGIAERIAPRVKRIETGRVGSVVARGEAEIGFQQTSELVTLPGIDYVGPLPEEVQRTTVFAAAIVTGAASVPAARRFIQFIAGPAARDAIRKSGLEATIAAVR
jgi:molybdate transport system substrate-binding protein